MTRADHIVTGVGLVAMFALGYYGAPLGRWFIGIGLGVAVLIVIIAAIADRRADRAEREEGAL